MSAIARIDLDAVRNVRHLKQLLTAIILDVCPSAEVEPPSEIYPDRRADLDEDLILSSQGGTMWRLAIFDEEDEPLVHILDLSRQLGRGRAIEILTAVACKPTTRGADVVEFKASAEGDDQVILDAVRRLGITAAQAVSRMSGDFDFEENLTMEMAQTHLQNHLDDIARREPNPADDQAEDIDDITPDERQIIAAVRRLGVSPPAAIDRLNTEACYDESSITMESALARLERDLNSPSFEELVEGAGDGQAEAE